MTGGAAAGPGWAEDRFGKPPDDVRSWLAKWGEFVGDYYRRASDAVNNAERTPTRAALRRAIALERDGRDLLLNVLSTFPSSLPRRVAGELARLLRDQDKLVEGLLEEPATEAPTGEESAKAPPVRQPDAPTSEQKLRITSRKGPIDAPADQRPAGAAPGEIPTDQRTALAGYLTLLEESSQRHVDLLQGSYRAWRWRAIAAAVAGAVAFVGGFLAMVDIGGWLGWLGLVVLTIGLLAGMTFGYIAVSDLIERWRLFLAALPAAVALLVVLWSLLTGDRGPAIIATGVVTALVGLAVLLMAGSVVSVLPMLVLFLLLQRHLVVGLTAGAVRE
jgi:hypothetical protein